MNTIPTIFNESPPSYTAVGGNERYASTGLSAVILNRPGRYSRRHFFQELEKTGFDYVISMELSSERYDIEELTGSFPFVRFILPHTKFNLGQQINIAASELDSPLFFVLWNDLKPVAGGTARRMAERLAVGQDDDKNDGQKAGMYKRLCTVPVIQNSRFETLPTLSAPAIIKKRVGSILFTPNGEGLPSLYPFDGIGIYDRERFIRIGGYDNTLRSAHWQLMDFGFRSHLWGEEICSSPQLKLSYDGSGTSEDNTADESYRRFYFKNLAPVFRGDYAHLPLRSFIRFMFSHHADPFAAWEDFSESRRWVKTNRFRWRCNVGTLAGRWDGISVGYTPFRV
jgi:hypothetical protein